MANEVRTRMIEGAVVLLAQQGLQATSFSEVLELTGAPRGSVYHHFPGGKDELVGEAVDAAGNRALDLLDQVDGASPEVVTEFFVDLWRTLLVRSGFGAGCAVVAVTVATDSRELIDRAAAVFRAWRGRLAALLEEGGLTGVDAERFAALLIASSEGAVVMCRAERSIEPFELVAEDVLARLAQLRGTG